MQGAAVLTYRHDSREDLNEMLRSPDYFDAFFGTLPQTRAIYAAHEQALRQNRELTGKRAQ